VTSRSFFRRVHITDKLFSVDQTVCADLGRSTAFADLDLRKRSAAYFLANRVACAGVTSAGPVKPGSPARTTDIAER
jgi:hypothetical protein